MKKVITLTALIFVLVGCSSHSEKDSVSNEKHCVLVSNPALMSNDNGNCTKFDFRTFFEERNKDKE
ncbi:hypothetical protein [Photobacterium angustum]|uniref:Lipoprotein n=1 Tax=Photobacterium angustum TaxID=661 RepID=A0A2T3LWB4_PHOAN|nr:hypothetical protein [Photobacterium angustum]KJF81615.1 hypothetical protein UB36_11285 [Photobacterium damselae subsp. damselae]KJF93707.1 hypothetical protein UB39_14490 [Photobacterium angustum]KJG02099.1 hypothetical protein UB35_08035 [Photobacterium angustum]KJG06091.1 hypothetical protein UB33_10535 [Photobacterium angustum]KJG40868.1 hypothetical protein UA35_11930 [Photobacterium angustum]